MQAFIKYIDGKFAWLSNETFGMISRHCDHGDALIRSFKNGRKNLVPLISLAPLFSLIKKIIDFASPQMTVFW